MTRNKKDPVWEQQYQASANHARDRTQAIRDLDDGSYATAVPVRLGTRLLLATAGHVLSQSHRLALVTEDGELRIAETRRDWRWDNATDVGFLEVASEQAGAIGPSVAQDGILTDFDVNARSEVLVLGFPRNTQYRTNTGIMCVPFSCPSVIVPPLEWRRPWPLENGQTIDLSANRDIVIRYVGADESVVIRNTNTGHEVAPTPVPGPHGLSGCGIWLPCWLVSQTTDLRVPNMQLIGLQHAALTTSRLLRGTRIAHWLDLLADVYPELGDDIKSIKRCARTFWEKARVVHRCDRV